jgi:hypothetical protein
MVLEPRRYTATGVVLVSSLSEEEAIAAVEEVVPESERGERLAGDGWSNWLRSDVRGGLITTSYPYKSMTIQFYGATRSESSGSMVAVVTWPEHSCD